MNIIYTSFKKLAWSIMTENLGKKIHIYNWNGWVIKISSNAKEMRDIFFYSFRNFLLFKTEWKNVE